MPGPPHPRLRNRHSLPRAVSNGAQPSDYAARELWTATPCDSLEYRRVVPTSESPTIRSLFGPRRTRGFEPAQEVDDRSSLFGVRANRESGFLRLRDIRRT